MRFQVSIRKEEHAFTLILAGLVVCGLMIVTSVCLAAGDKWIKKTDMPTARSGHLACVVNGKIYAMGGWLPSGAPTAIVEEYDPLTDKWTVKADMLAERGGFSASVVNGKIYAIGGTGVAGGDAGGTLATVEEYDPLTDKWTKKGDMPTARWGLSTSVVNGRIYAIGGCRIVGIAPCLSTVEEYDPSTDEWVKKADMPTARMGLCTSVVDGMIYAIGGEAQSVSNWWPTLSTVEVYDPSTDKWMGKADMPTPRTKLSCDAPVVNGYIHVIGGGANLFEAFPMVEVYDPATDRWVKKTDMPTARMYLTTSLVDGKIYAIGGWTGNVDLATVEKYTPEGWKSVSPQDKLTTTWGKIKHSR